MLFPLQSTEVAAEGNAVEEVNSAKFQTGSGVVGEALEEDEPLDDTDVMLDEPLLEMPEDDPRET